MTLSLCCQVTTDCRHETQFGDNLLLTQAVTCAGASFAAGFVAKYVARVQTIVGAVIAAEGAVVVLLVFPSLSVTLRFVTVLAWGVAVAVLQTQLLCKHIPCYRPFKSPFIAHSNPHLSPTFNEI